MHPRQANTPSSGIGALGGYILVSAVALGLGVSGVLGSSGIRLLTVFVPAVAVVFLRFAYKRWITPISVFIILTSLFCFGQVWRDLFGFPNPSIGGYSNVSELFPEVVIESALTLSLCTVSLVVTGSLIYACFGRGALIEFIPRRTEERTDAPDRVLWLTLAAVLGVLVILGDRSRVSSVVARGYADGFKYQSTLLYTANAIFPVAIIGVLVVWRNRPRVAGAVLLGVTVRNLLVVLTVHSRGQAVVESIVYLMIWGLYRNRRSRRSLFLWAVGLGAALVVLPFVSYSRTGSGSSGVIDFMFRYNAVSVFLTEFGGSLSTVAYSVQYIEAGGVPSGASYLLYLVGTAVPFLGFAIRSAAGDVLTAASLNHYFYIGGLGGSYVADAYINLGVRPLFVIVCVAVGFGIAWLSVQAGKTWFDGRVYLSVWCWFVLLGAMTGVRGYLSDIAGNVKTGAIVAVAVWLIAQILKAWAFPGGRKEAIPIRRTNGPSHDLTTQPKQAQPRTSGEAGRTGSSD